MLRAQGGDGGRDVVKTEINHRIAPGDDGPEVVALIDLADDLEFRNVRGTGQQRLAHAPFGTGDDDASHTLFQNPARLQRRPERVAIFSAHGHERQAVFLRHHAHHGQRGLDRDRVGLDEQVFEQRIIFRVNSLR